MTTVLRVKVTELEDKKKIIQDVVGAKRIKLGNNWNTPGLNEVIYRKDLQNLSHALFQLLDMLMHYLSLKWSEN